MQSISVCIPVHNRTYDLRRTLPRLIMAANSEPPVEIVILDYNSPDDLQCYIYDTAKSGHLSNDNELVCRRYTGRDYYHMAHARNLSVMAASGEIVVIMSADIYPAVGFFSVVRAGFAGHNWQYDRDYKGVIACRRDDFITIGGYDERFEFYGPEDRDLHRRMLAYNGDGGVFPSGLVKVIRTPDSVKVKNYRLSIGKREMAKRMSIVFKENITYNVMVANNGRKWGQW